MRIGISIFQAALVLVSAVFISWILTNCCFPREVTNQTPTYPTTTTATTTMSGISNSLRRAAPLLFPPNKKHTATVIFLHGLGDTGYGWESAVENWRRRSKLDEVKFILPHAPNIPVTCNGGMRMPGWFDIVALGTSVDDLITNQDEAGILIARDYLRGLVQSEIDAGIPADRIVLGGFSQGAAISLLTGLTAKAKLAGIVVMSGWLPLHLQLPSFLAADGSDQNRETPVLLCHGESDVIVPKQFGQRTMETLKEHGFDAKMTMYPGMGHSACPEELDEVEAFLASQLPEKGDS